MIVGSAYITLTNLPKNITFSIDQTMKNKRPVIIPTANILSYFLSFHIFINVKEEEITIVMELYQPGIQNECKAHYKHL